MFFRGLDYLAMRNSSSFHSSIQNVMDDKNNLIHISNFADTIIPKLLRNEYKSAGEQYLLECFKKLDQNIERDNTNRNALLALGWEVMVVWECEVKDLSVLATKINEFLNPNLS